jgi:restriction system protein
MALIRASFASTAASEDVATQLAVVLSLGSRGLENLVEDLYHRLGYETELTPSRYDGGRDVIATRGDRGRKERILIDCKNWRTAVGVKQVRELFGVVNDEGVGKGVLVATNGFTKGAVAFASRHPRLELLSGTALVSLMSEERGNTWHIDVDRFVFASQRRHP